MNKIAIITLSVLALLPLAANAGEVENRLHNENARINQGVNNGSLSAREYRNLDHRQERIQAQRNRELRHNDGHYKPGQYQQLNREENHLSNSIYRDKHN